MCFIILLFRSQINLPFQKQVLIPTLPKTKDEPKVPGAYGPATYGSVPIGKTLPTGSIFHEPGAPGIKCPNSILAAGLHAILLTSAAAY